MLCHGFKGKVFLFFFYMLVNKINLSHSGIQISVTFNMVKFVNI